MIAHESSRRAALVLALPALAMTLAGCSRDDLAPDCFKIVDGVCVIPGGTDVGIDCATMPVAAVGAEYSFTPAVAGGSGQYGNWMASGLPAGLSIDPNTGEISGIPTAPPSPDNQPGEYTVQLSVLDSIEGQTFEATCGTLVVNPQLNALDLKLTDYRCLDYQSTMQEMLGVLEGGDGTEITCSIGMGGGATCPIGDGDGRLAPGISFDEATCTHSGSVNTDRFGTWVWMIDLEQSGYKTTIPFCATNDVPTFHDILVTANGVTDDPLKPALYEYDPDMDLGFGNGSYHWDINSPDCVGTPAECNNFGFRFDLTCSPFDVAPPWAVSLAPSMGGSLGLSHEMNATGPAPGDDFRFRPFVASFEMSYCTSSDGNFCSVADIPTFEANAQTKYHFDVVGYPVEQ
ncbi:Ig domain-containing protein [Nannocystaceae bacterium ST9]